MCSTYSSRALMCLDSAFLTDSVSCSKFAGPRGISCETRKLISANPQLFNAFLYSQLRAIPSSHRILKSGLLANDSVRLRLFLSGISLTMNSKQFAPNCVFAWPAWFSLAEGAMRLDHRCPTVNVAAEQNTTASQLVRVELKSASIF